MTYEKIVSNFYTLQYFGAPWPGLPGPKFTNLATDVQQLLGLSMCQILLVLTTLLPKFVDFVDSVTDKNSKRHVSANHAATTRTSQWRIQERAD